MKKAVIIGSAIAAVLLIVILIGNIGKSNKKVNLNLDIVVESKPELLHEWGYKIDNPEIVKYVTSYPVNDEKNIGKDNKTVNKNIEEDEKRTQEEGYKINEPVKVKYRFAGLKKGETKITIYYYNIITNEVLKQNTYKVKVSRNMDIKLVK